MLCWNSLSIVSKRTGSARLFADELSAIMSSIFRGNGVGKDDFVLRGSPGVMLEFEILWAQFLAEMV